MQVSEIMTTDVYTCRPEDTLKDAAKIMREIDCGAVPVVDGRTELVGILTDRDICLCASEHDEPLTVLQVSEAITWKPVTCSPEDDLDCAESQLGTHQIRRLPVVDPDGHIVGIVSFGDIARARANSHESANDPTKVAATITAISQPTPSDQRHIDTSDGARESMS
jgi:CBS domain-containing protein